MKARTTDDKPQRQYTQAEVRTLENFGLLPDDASVRLPVVCAIFSVSPGTVWRWTKEGTLSGYRKVRGCAMWQVGGIRRLTQSQSAK